MDSKRPVIDKSTIIDNFEIVIDVDDANKKLDELIEKVNRLYELLEKSTVIISSLKS
ncbi:MAG: hypothetical protein K1W18_11495 [Oscillospiraceae bacterium]